MSIDTEQVRRLAKDWELLLAVVKEHKCDCGENSPKSCRGRVCCELVHVIAACEKERDE